MRPTPERTHAVAAAAADHFRRWRLHSAISPSMGGAQLSALAIGRAAGTLRSGRRAVPELRRWEAVLFWLLLAVVLLAPLPLGSNRPLPASALAAAVGVLACVWGIGRLLGRPQPVVSMRRFWPGLALVQPRCGLGRPAGGAVHPGIAAPPVLE